MSLDLSGPRAKIKRASEHLDAIEREDTAFIKAHADPQTFDYAFDGTWHIVSVHPPFGEPPLSLSIICGDAVHNMRSALDHLIWQLVLAEGGKPGRWNYFPIFRNRDDFVNKVRFPKNPKRNPGVLHGLDPNGRPWAIIEESQPYNGGKLGRTPDAHPLFIVATLDNTDKHRTLHVYQNVPVEPAVRNVLSWNPGARLLEYRSCREAISTKHKTEIVRMRFAQEGPDPQVRVNHEIALLPSFGDGSLFASVGAIAECRDYIAWLIERFPPLFNQNNP